MGESIPERVMLRHALVVNPPPEPAPEPQALPGPIKKHSQPCRNNCCKALGRSTQLTLDFQDAWDRKTLLNPCWSKPTQVIMRAGFKALPHHKEGGQPPPTAAQCPAPTGPAGTAKPLPALGDFRKRHGPKICSPENSRGRRIPFFTKNLITTLQPETAGSFLNSWKGVRGAGERKCQRGERENTL